MGRLVRARVLLEEADALGVTIDDLVAAAAERPRTDADVPTVAEHIDAIKGSFTAGTAATYMSYWKLAEARFGRRRVDTLGEPDCQVVVDDAVARARRRRPGSEGRSAEENCIAALRALFAQAQKAGYMSHNPAAELDKPRRLPNKWRGLDDGELAEAIEAVQMTSHDAALDLLLVRFHLESGARREGALNLVLGDQDHRRATVWLDEKFGIKREQPVTPSLLTELEAHAHSRGATKPDDSVFRTARGRPITRRRYNTLFDHVQAALPWTARTPVTAHVLRHTTATAVERIAGEAVAEAFLGHAPTSVYTKGRIEEVAAALATLTGEHHPLAVR